MLYSNLIEFSHKFANDVCKFSSPKPEAPEELIGPSTLSNDSSLKAPGRYQPNLMYSLQGFGDEKLF